MDAQRTIGIDQLRRSPLNPRRDFGDEELAELADSIRTKGLLQPIIVRPDAGRGGYEITPAMRFPKTRRLPGAGRRTRRSHPYSSPQPRLVGAAQGSKRLSKEG